jgi:hypothetical protein
MQELSYISKILNFFSETNFSDIFNYKDSLKKFNDQIFQKALTLLSDPKRIIIIHKTDKKSLFK